MCVELRTLGSFLQRQRRLVPPSCDFFIFFSPLQETRIRVIEKESSGQTSRRLSVINPSPEGSQSLVFSAETSEELEDWLDALHQHRFDQSECVSAEEAGVCERPSGQSSPLIRVSLAENQASGSTAATS